MFCNLSIVLVFVFLFVFRFCLLLYHFSIRLFRQWLCFCPQVLMYQCFGEFFSAIIWLKYCWHGVKHYPINQSSIIIKLILKRKERLTQEFQKCSLFTIKPNIGIYMCQEYNIIVVELCKYGHLFWKQFICWCAKSNCNAGSICSVQTNKETV